MPLDQKQAVALFRYSVIAPLETGSFDPGMSRNDFFRDAAGKTYTDPEGRPKKISFHTIKKWHRRYKRDGFEGLMPQSRSDEGVSRVLHQDQQEQIRYLMDRYPRITAAEIHRRLLSNGSIDIGEVSISTVERFVRLVRRDFDAYVLRYNRSVHSSLEGMSPQERFFSEPERIRRLSEFDAAHSFMLETERRVSADGVVSIDKREYEVHYRYAKQRIRIRYSPDFSETYIVEPSGELTSIDMRPLNKTDNSLAKREKVRLSGTEGGTP